MLKEFIYKRNSVKEKGEKGISKEIGGSVNIWEKFGKEYFVVYNTQCVEAPHIKVRLRAAGGESWLERRKTENKR